MDDFKITLSRMYNDAKVLNENNCWFNSCYLSGYVIECYAKILLEHALIKGLSISKNSIRKYSHNITEMNLDLSNVISYDVSIGNYCVDLSKVCPNLFATWNPNMRYSDNSHIWNQKNSSNDIINEIDQIMYNISKMKLDGVI